MIALYNPTMVPSEVIKEFSDRIESHFQGKEREEYNNALSLLGYPHTPALLENVFGFFENKLNLSSFDFDYLDLNNLKKINIKQIAFEFADYAGITKKTDLSDSQIDFLFEIFSKMVRIFLHDISVIAFESAPELKQLFDEFLKDTIKRICAIEKFDAKEIYDEFRLNEFFDTPQVEIEENDKKYRKKIEPKYTHYLICNLSDKQLLKLATCFHQYNISDVPKSEIIAFFSSNGELLDTLKINPSKLNVFIHLIYLMKVKRIIRISKGRAIWQECIQRDIIDSETKLDFKDDMTKLSSQICLNENGKYTTDIKEATEILNEILKK